MDRGSLLQLTLRPPPSAEPPGPKVQWTRLERFMGWLSPPMLSRRFSGKDALIDTWNYHYRTHRRGYEYPTPDEDAIVVTPTKYKPRSSISIFESHTAACRTCSEAVLWHTKMCVVGIELKERMDRDVWYHRPGHSPVQARRWN